MTTESKISSIDDTPVEAVSAPARQAAKRQPKIDGVDIGLSGKKKTITIHVSDAENGQEPVFVGLNGYGYQIPRGTPVEVPAELVSILENAKTSTFHPNRATGELEERVHNRFAFSVH